MELSAVYHCPDKRFCYALNPGQFLIRIRAKSNDLRRVTLHTVDKYLPVSRMDTRTSQVMEKVTTDGIHDYFEAVISIDMVCLRYFFELADRHGKVCYYGNYQFYEHKISHIDNMFDCPQNLREEERFVIPQWAANQVVYQIFPTRFAASQPVPDRVWYQYPISPRADLKGDLRGILSRLPHLRELGVDVLYMTPIFQANSSHKYDTVDYFQVDSRLGTEEDLRQLVYSLKEATNYEKPVIVKIAAVHNVSAIASGIARSGADIIAIDGYRGGTGAAPTRIRDNVGIPIELALASVDKRLRDEGIRDDVSIVVGGSIRSSADVFKAIALGADCCYIGTASLLALGCHLCRSCHEGKCNWGIATQRPDLVKRLNPDIGSQRLVNMLTAWNHEIKEMMGGMGINSIESLKGNRLMLRGIGMTEKELEILGIKHAGE